MLSKIAPPKSVPCPRLRKMLKLLVFVFGLFSICSFSAPETHLMAPAVLGCRTRFVAKGPRRISAPNSDFSESMILSTSGVPSCWSGLASRQIPAGWKLAVWGSCLPFLLRELAKMWKWGSIEVNRAAHRNFREGPSRIIAQFPNSRKKRKTRKTRMILQTYLKRWPQRCRTQ